jgi:hypothetical protein
MHVSDVALKLQCGRGPERLTLPSEASNSFTGHSRTEATKQNEAGSRGDAVGYQTKSSTGAAWGNSWAENRSCVAAKQHQVSEAQRCGLKQMIFTRFAVLRSPICKSSSGVGAS